MTSELPDLGFLSGSVAYVAAPYTDDDPRVSAERANKVDEVAVRLFNLGIHVFSPLTHWVALAEIYTMPADWEHWRAYDLAMLERCDCLIVLELEGWTSSVGVQAEIDKANALNMPILYLPEEALT